MIEIRVRHDKPVYPFDTTARKIRQDHGTGAAATAAKRWARVIQQDMILRAYDR